jgi:hypothetical protein
MRVAALLTIAMVAVAPALCADEVVVDLAAEETSTVPVVAGPLHVRIVNRLPRMDYRVSVRREVIPIPPFGPTPVGRFATVSDCTGVLKLLDELEKAADEKKVGELVARIRAERGGVTCTTAELAEIQAGLARTEADGGVFDIRPGEQITIVVSRKDGTKSWTRVATTGPRGVWLTTYGASIAPDRDERFFARAKGNGKFEVAKEERAESVKVIPSVFFTWLPASRQLRDWSWGPTAGLGVSDDRPVVFAGWGATYNWNLGLVAGAALVQETRLSGRYRLDPAQELAEAVPDSQLNGKVYRVRWLAAITFRFGSNPFTSTPAAGSSAPESKKGTKAEEKPASGP